MKTTFASLTLALLLAVAGSTAVFAQGTPQAIEPASGVPAGATGADVPFTNDGANRPVLETITPDGQTIPIDPAAADAVKAPEVEHMVDPDVGDGAQVVHGDPAHGKKGLPQFDVTTFAKQIFWLVVVFMALYTVNSRKILPTISAVIENRRERVASDLRAAEDLKNQVSKVRGEYEAAVAAAQAEAQQIILELQTEIKKHAEIQDADFKERSEKAVSDVEARIDVARTRIMNDLGAIAASLTVDIAKSVAGINTNEAAAQRAVDSLQGKAQAA